MPRCYMVKKQSNKYQPVQRDCWDQSVSSSSTGAPESPTEGSVAPLCYTPLTNRTNLKIRTYEDSKIREFEDSKIRRFEDSKIRRFEDSKIRRFEDSKIRRLRFEDLKI
ncbi:hypothetical protein JTB14_005081 [Gonioctena quinquepunctata]|nr:hypothetical protein JTB14_005081 [Gonioctena quinquepunctata]